jgi:hypothetical protein
MPAALRSHALAQACPQPPSKPGCALPASGAIVELRHEYRGLSRSSMAIDAQTCTFEDVPRCAAHDRRANAVGPLKKLKEFIQCR